MSVNAANERRKTKRRAILDSFSLSLVIPKKGPHRLGVLDLSEDGIGFNADIEEENPMDFPIKKGDSLQIHFYLNQSLFIPLTLSIVQIQENGGTRRIGAEFKNTSDTASLKSLRAFLSTLDGLAGAAKVAGL